MRTRLAAVRDQLDALRKTDIFRLWTQAAEYEAGGRNLLQTMAEEVDARIAHARRRLEHVPAAGKRR
jgi:hypothetical protein